VIGRATVPDRPSNVSGLLLLGFTAAGSCAAGIGFAFLLEARRPGYANAPEVEQDLGYPVISMIPLVHKPRKSRKGADRWQVFEAYGLTEAIRTLVYSLLPKSQMQEGVSGKIVAITSSYPDEGKSTIALSLARQAGFSGLRTLLIEGDLRKGGLREGLTTIKPTYGLVHLLRATVNDAYECISTEPDSGVDIMLGFGPADDAFTLLRGERMAHLLDAVRSRYDLVVIDCAPIMAVSETRSLVELADEVVFVVRWKSTERSAARTAVRDLERMGAKIAGMVMNQVDLREHLKYEDADRLAYQEKYQNYVTT
jgi:capsular exopolysaccharide synthesis family protein